MATRTQATRIRIKEQCRLDQFNGRESCAETRVQIMDEKGQVVFSTVLKDGFTFSYERADATLRDGKTKRKILTIHPWRERGMYDIAVGKAKFGVFPLGYVFLVVHNVLLYHKSDYYDIEEDHQILREDLMRKTQDEHRVRLLERREADRIRREPELAALRKALGVPAAVVDAAIVPAAVACEEAPIAPVAKKSVKRRKRKRLM